MKIIKCSKCNEFSKTEPYCEHCNQLLFTEETRKQEVLQSHNERLAKPKVDHPVLKAVKAMQNHRFFVVQMIGHLLYGIGFVVFSIISFIAWLVAAIAA
ncbi:hypothetical protein AB4865_06580 [Capnocytophaga sp. ARDL2]|uniref:hypothetical protein n=1 Tax=Capnocytophaga sp. ARDL2 TaxID=3238809 RepID=UPI003557B880